MQIRISKSTINSVSLALERLNANFVVIAASILSVAAIAFSYANDYIVRYGDSESHLNIAKRVTDSITPGFAQLGGIWLPLPHLLMVPFIWSDTLWRSGLAGAIVSGVAFIVSTVFLYKTTLLLTHSRVASLVTAAVFAFNPNALYMQSTPMTEMLLIAFFVLSSYYFIKYLLNKDQLPSLLLAALFGFCAVLTRYDGWFLIGIQAGALFLYHVPVNKLILAPHRLKTFIKSEKWKKMEGHIVVFSTLAFFGVVLWLAWDYIILGDPFYFTTSEFSAKSQQDDWRAKGQLPAYHNLPVSFAYYFVTAMSNAGVLIFFPGLAGVAYYLGSKINQYRWLVGLILGVPFIFNVLTLFLGQSVIFIPHLTPGNFDHTLFNVRYGLMVLPLLAVGWGYLFYRASWGVRILLVALFVAQFGLYYVGYSKVITWQDGVAGLSSAQRPPAEQWIKENYDDGLVLMDDYARTVSVVRSGVPMDRMIYVGNKPYWEESLVTPDKHVKWIVMQENDAVWASLSQIPARRARLDKYFEKVYQSERAPNIAIYKKKEVSVAQAEETQRPTFWNLQCMDTMKFSRDEARNFLVRADADAFIERELGLIADSGANCVSIGTPYDEEFVPVLSKWANKAHEKNLRVWFRGNMSGWEGWFGYPVFTNPGQHHAGISELITTHPEMFEAGDIFTPAPEPENGMLGDPRQSAQNKQRFLEFLPESYSNCVNAFKEIGKDVSCGYFSVNGDVAKEVFTKELLVDIGDVLVIDHYVRDPEQLVKDIQGFNEQLDTLVMLGEIGAPIPEIHGDMTEQQQAEYMSQLMQKLYEQQDILLGLNYWVLRGGSTSLLNDDSPRQAYASIKDYFAPAHIKGTVTNTLGQPVPNLRIQAGSLNVESMTNNAGEYNILIPATKTEIKLAADDYVGEKSYQAELISASEFSKDFVVEPVRKSLWYNIQLWWKHVTN